jgi:hypothetical protein
VAASGWKLLDNGTYIRIYDARTTAKTDAGSSARAGSGSRGEGSSTSSSYDSGWEQQPDGSYKRRQETYTSYSSGSGSARGSTGQAVSLIQCQYLCTYIMIRVTR